MTSTPRRCARSRCTPTATRGRRSNLLELSVARGARSSTARGGWTPSASQQTIQRRALLYDKSGEEHYNLISALHKSMRNSDPDAAVYWLARMVEAGEDPLYIARRLVRFASEDIGNADPQALTVAVAAKDAVHFIGMPEGNTALAQAAIYLATAPKSNAVYEAYNRAAEDAQNDVAEPVPLHLRNAPTKLMKDSRVREGLSLRARRGGSRGGHVVPAAGAGRTAVLRADGTRLREGDQAPAGRVGRDQEAAPNDRVNSASMAARPLSRMRRVPVR